MTTEPAPTGAPASNRRSEALHRVRGYCARCIVLDLLLASGSGVYPEQARVLWTEETDLERGSAVEVAPAHAGLDARQDRERMPVVLGEVNRGIPVLVMRTKGLRSGQELSSSSWHVQRVSQADPSLDSSEAIRRPEAIGVASFQSAVVYVDLVID